MFSTKKFSEKLLPLKYNFLLLLSFLSTPMINYIKFFKNMIILKVILCLKKRKEVLNKIFLFCLRSSVPPLIRGPLKNTFHEKDFSWTIFFQKNSCFTLFLSNPFDNFYRIIQNTVFLKKFLYNQKEYSENCFSF